MKLWDADTGRELRTLAHGFRGVKFNILAFSPDGLRLAAPLWTTGTKDMQVKVVDVATGQEVFTLPRQPTGIFAGIAFSPDGKLLATTHLSRVDRNDPELTVKLWNAETGAELRSLNARSRVGYQVAFSADSKRLAAGGKVWDAATGQVILQLPGWEPGSVMAFSPNGRQVAHLVTGGLIRVYDVTSARLVTTISTALDEEDEDLPLLTLCLSFSPDGRLLAGPSYNNTVKVWHAGTGKELHTFRGHRGPIFNVVFRPDGKQLATASTDGTVRVWELNAPGPFAPPAFPVSLADGRTVTLNSSRDGGVPKLAVQIREFPGGREVWALPPTAGVGHWAFSPGGQRLAAIVNTRTLMVWDLASGREILKLDEQPVGLGYVKISHDGRRLLRFDANRTLKLWDVDTGKEVLRLENLAGTQPVLSPDGQRLAWGLPAKPPQGGAVMIVDATTGATLFTLEGHANHVSRVAFSLDGKRVASAGTDQTIKIWDATTGRELQTLRGHTLGINALAFSPDGNRLASGSQDKTVKIWNTTTGREVLTLRGHSAFVTDVAFSRDGHRVLSTDNRGGVRVWDGTPRDDKPPNDP